MAPNGVTCGSPVASGKVMIWRSGGGGSSWRAMSAAASTTRVGAIRIQTGFQPYDGRRV